MSSHGAINWHKIAGRLEDLHFGDNNIAVVELPPFPNDPLQPSRKYCIGQHPQGLFAFAHSCPHAGALLAEGRLDALGQVVCPLHHYKFCIKTGRNISGEGYYLRHWPVEVKEDGVYIGI